MGSSQSLERTPVGTELMLRRVTTNGLTQRHRTPAGAGTPETCRVQLQAANQKTEPFRRSGADNGRRRSRSTGGENPPLNDYGLLTLRAINGFASPFVSD